ncbi:uncharacterized protein K444DRAFT_638553 [Hyaloscypha bicolor E]|uniref:Collagen-like protein Mcl1 n=1 Tax=Hyaloscypha bicolor E TaxID=1095630 RepID=A0A2J6SGT9_9HELO|nr:uncharacterized protein K444DRAFT_638553 [Hyaloscypha bicolor E]PMD49973.1 hypothetical protein K444DRAFT_638553 [Hyaloscypha bicolor E]
MHFTTVLTAVLFAISHLPFSLASVIDFSPAPISLFKRDLASLCQPSAGVSNLVDSPFPCNKMQGVMQICGLSVDLDGLNPTADHLSEQQKCLCDSNGKGYDVWRYTQGCSNCLRLHGGGFLNQDEINAESSSYCSASATVPFESFRANFAYSIFSTETTQSDVLSTRTEVNLYWTDTVGKAGATPTNKATTTSNGGTTPTSTGAATAAATSSSAAQVLGYTNLLGVVVATCCTFVISLV